MTVLWTFETQAKTDVFAAILQGADIPYEAQSKGKNKNSGTEVTISVEERDYEKAKKLLVRFRRRKTSA